LLALPGTTIVDRPGSSIAPQHRIGDARINGNWNQHRFLTFGRTFSCNPRFEPAIRRTGPDPSKLPTGIRVLGFGVNAHVGQFFFKTQDSRTMRVFPNEIKCGITFMEIRRIVLLWYRRKWIITLFCTINTHR
jgi:hypothetical protein